MQYHYVSHVATALAGAGDAAEAAGAAGDVDTAGSSNDRSTTCEAPAVKRAGPVKCDPSATSGMM